MELNKNKKHRWYLYVLKLQDKKYYVGITSKTPEIRMQEHLNGVRVAYWTAKHRPMAVIYQEDLGYIERAAAERRENKVVRVLMKQRGMNNVRGGDLTSVEKYTKRFGYYIEADLWEILIGVVFLIVVIIYLMVDKLFLS